MPFKGTAATELGLKRAIIEAAESGADEVGWSPGLTHARRYGSALEGITAVRRTTDGDLEVKAGGQWHDLDAERQAELERLMSPGDRAAFRAWAEEDYPSFYDYDVAGDGDAANARYKAAVEAYRRKQFKPSEPLTISSKGMEQQYDEAMVNIANKIGKPFGATVEKGQVRAGRPGDYSDADIASYTNFRIEPMPGAATPNQYQVVADSKDGFPTGFSGPLDKAEADQALVDIRDGKAEDAWVMKITPELKRQVLGKGLPLLSADAIGTALLDPVAGAAMLAWGSARPHAGSKRRRRRRWWRTGPTTSLQRNRRRMSGLGSPRWGSGR
jgi:hypothetical protein